MKLIKVVKSTNLKKKYDALFKDKDGKEKKNIFWRFWIWGLYNNQK